MASGGSGCSQHKEQKKGLLVAVSSSVDKIISHFSTTRNIVQKAQLGDSRLSPEVGHLILNTLCPALYALVGDRLKPFQKDVITGRRRNSPWTLVEASVKPGPSTRSLHGLYCKICQLPQLSSSQKKFNAFIFGLLNAKLLDLWISHLQQNSGTLSMLYLPGGFLSLTDGSFQPHFDELLLLIQPLSILTFHLDLLFEHHQIRVNLRLLQPSAGHPPCHTQGPVPPVDLKRGHGQSHREEASLQETSKGQCREDGGDQDGHPAAKEESGGAVRTGSEPRGPAPNQPPVTKQCPSTHTDGPVQHTLQQVLQWGAKLTQTLVGNEELPANSFKAPATGTCTKPAEEKRGAGGEIKATTWWGQLSQASRVYTTPSRENFPFTRWTKLRLSTGDNCPATPMNRYSKKPEQEPQVAKVHGGALGTKLAMITTNIQGNHQEQQLANLEGSPKGQGEGLCIRGSEGSDPPTGGNEASGRTGPSLDSSTKGTEGPVPQAWLDRGLGTQKSHEERNQVTRLKESTDYGTAGSQESSDNGKPGSQESPDHGKPGSQESPDHGTPGSKESPDHGTPGSQESPDHGKPGTQESPDHGKPGTQESPDHGTPGSQKSPDVGDCKPGPREALDKKSFELMPQNSHAKGNAGTHAIAGQGPAPRSGEADSPSSGTGIWLGHLFGAQCSTSRGSPTDGETIGIKSRRPSSWLTPNINVIGLLRKGVPPEKTALPEVTSNEPQDAPKPLRTVRAICDHSGSEQSHLSFRKDDVLQLLSTVDEDWIRCCHGNSTGLVPVGYTSLIL